VPTFHISGPNGEEYELEGAEPPTEQDISQLFGHAAGGGAGPKAEAAPAPKAEDMLPPTAQGQAEFLGKAPDYSFGTNLGEFARGAKKEMVDSLIQAVLHPVDTAKGLLTGGPQAAAALEPSARAAMQQMGLGGGAQEAGAAALRGVGKIPIVGSMALGGATAGQDIMNTILHGVESGRPQEISHAVGRAAGILVPMAEGAVGAAKKAGVVDAAKAAGQAGVGSLAERAAGVIRQFGRKAGAAAEAGAEGAAEGAAQASKPRTMAELYKKTRKDIEGTPGSAMAERFKYVAEEEGPLNPQERRAQADRRAQQPVTYEQRVQERRQALEQAHPDAHPELLDQAARAELHPVTGLPNKAAFERAFAEARAAGGRRAPGVASTDLSGFKGVNDTFGHGAGDSALRAVATHLLERSKDAGVQVFHAGGDEFLILGKTPGETESFMSSLREDLKGAHFVDEATGRQIPMPGVDFGVGADFAKADADLLARRAADPNRIQRGQLARAPQEGAAAGAAGGGKNVQAPLTEVPLLGSESGRGLGRVVGRKPAGVIERALESSFAGGGPFERFREAQQTGPKGLITGLAEDVVNRISKFKGTPEELGNMVQTEIGGAEDAFRAHAQEMYGEIDRLAKGVKAPTAALKAVAQETKAQLARLSKILPASEFTKTSKLLDQITRAPRELDFSTMQQFRSNLLGKVMALREEIPDRAAGLVKRLTGLSDESMMQAAQKVPGLADRVRTANEFWRNGRQTFNDSVVARMAKTAPEKVHTLLRQASLEDVDRFKSTVGQETLQATKAALIRDAIEDATKGEVAQSFLKQLASKLTGAPGAGVGGGGEGPRLSGRALEGILENRSRFGEQKLRRLFSPEEMEGITRLTETAKKIGPQRNLLGALLGSALNVDMLWGTGRGLAELAGTGDATTLLKTGGKFAALNVLARVLTRPGGAATLSRYMDALERVQKKLPAEARWVTPPPEGSLKLLAIYGKPIAKMVEEEARKEREKRKGEGASAGPGASLPPPAPRSLAAAP